MKRPVIGVLHVGVTGLVISSCTFGNLADYEIRSCNPGHQSQAEDECDELNHGDTTGCDPYQCDEATKRCIRKTRDDDRDGIAPPSCGGTDCDDHDPLNGGTIELCDGRDNNCNGLIDDGIDYVGSQPVALLQSAPSLGSLPDPSIVGDSLGVVGSVVATTMKATECVDAFGLDSSSPDALLGESASCSFLSKAAEGALEPRQPAVKRIAGGVAGTAAVFVETSGCLRPGTLGYRWFEPPGSAGAFDLPCPNGSGVPAGGVALPALESLGDQSTLALLFYDAAIESRLADSTVTGCASLKSAALDAMVVDTGATAPGPIVHVTDGIATAPPGTLSVPGVGALVAASVEASKSASIFLVTPDAKSSELVSLSGFTGARAVGLASGPKAASGSLPIAIIGELGCAPQSIVVAFGTLALSDGVPALMIRDTTTVVTATTGHRAIRPAVVWQQDAPIAAGTRSEWLITWTTDGPGAMARRYDSSGAPLSNAFSIGQGFVNATPAPGGQVYVVAASPTAFESVGLLCPTK